MKLFTVNNYYSPLMEKFTVNSNYLPLIKTLTVNKIHQLLMIFHKSVTKQKNRTWQ